jgi:hypothetical protein
MRGDVINIEGSASHAPICQTTQPGENPAKRNPNLKGEELNHMLNDQSRQPMVVVLKSQNHSSPLYSTLELINTPGQALEPGTRCRMESSLGHYFPGSGFTTTTGPQGG